MFDPKSKKYPYPLDTSTHYLKITKNKGIVFDKDYPYIDKSKGFRFKKGLVRFVIVTIVFLLTKIRLGLKIKGRKNLKKNKKIIKEGVVSVSNHIHMWDYLAFLMAIRHFKPYYLAWDKNVNNKSGSLVRLTGGIPIPVNDINATKAYLKAINGLLDSGGWLHIYAEGSMWEFYKPIRPFKLGAAHIAVINNKPILPISFSYRKPNFIRKHIFRQIATITVNVGELIYPNNDLPKKEREIDLTKRCHEAVCKLSENDNNLYPPIYDCNERIDYY